MVMIAAALVLLCLTGAGGAEGQTLLSEAVSRGDAAAREGRYAAANRAYDEALSLADPENKQVLAGLFYKKARALREAGQILVALEAVERALSYQEHQTFEALHSELQQRASQTVFDSGQIQRALHSARGFGVSGGVPSLNLWVGFAFDSAALTRQGLRQATEMAEAMLSAEFEDSRFLLVGHTDARGRAEYNLDLSYRRADGLRQWLLERFGFRAERISAEGRGKQDLVALGNSPADHARNRRVELRLLD